MDIPQIGGVFVAKVALPSRIIVEVIRTRFFVNRVLVEFRSSTGDVATLDIEDFLRKYEKASTRLENIIKI